MENTRGQDHDFRKAGHRALTNAQFRLAIRHFALSWEVVRPSSKNPCVLRQVAHWWPYDDAGNLNVFVVLSYL